MINRKVLSALFLIICTSGYAQWSGSQGNEWIDYNQSYLRVNISEKGIYKIPFTNLPSEFPKDPKKIQIWHRGKEVSIISTENSEIVFYAVPNDGSSDSLLFRPSSARLNPYVSFFSDQSSYFITSKVDAQRAELVGVLPYEGEPEPYHYQTELKIFKNQFSFSTLTPSPLVFNNSFYENINSWTGRTLFGPKAVGYTAGNSILTDSFTLTNFLKLDNDKPVLNMLVHGLHNGKHSIRSFIGSSTEDVAEVAALDFQGLGGMKMGPTVVDKVPNSGKGILSLKSVSNDNYDWFALSYYTLTYPQRIRIVNNKSTYFNFKPTQTKLSRVRIEEMNPNFDVYDVTNVDKPKILTGKITNNMIDLVIPRTANNGLALLAISKEEIKVVTSDKIVRVDFTPLLSSSNVPVSGNKALKPGSFDYLIITSDTLKSAAVEYGKYRSSVSGGGYNTLVLDVRNIYDQFNYGEPSAVGIKRFVNYMLKDGIRDSHNLLLVGISITAPDSAQLRLKKELPHEVPTIGDPGADILLVSGVAGLGENVPAMPVGRISAFNNQQVMDYLSKVKLFESDRSDKGWQKKVLHLNGGKTSDEIVQLSTILKNLSPAVENGDLGGNVKAFIKPSTIETEKVDISKEVNDGVGMITYFGHGSPLITDLDMGKISDVSRNYINNGKYSLMYFNGCGVGNVYSGRSVLPLSTDWVLSPNKGAIAAIANSYNSYVSPTSQHLKVLYDELFSQDFSNNATIGQKLNKVSVRILNLSSDAYDIANIHQSNLQGDPAIRLFKFSSPDYAFSDDGSALRILGESGDKTIQASSTLKGRLIIANHGKYEKGQLVPLEIKYFLANNSTTIKVEKVNAVAYVDTLYFSFTKDLNISKIVVVIDPDNTISETEKGNNRTELEMDWPMANGLTIYPDVNNKDIVPPMLKVTFAERLITNKGRFFANPVLNVELKDNSTLVVDPGLIDVYIRPCWDERCEFKKILLEGDKVNLNLSASRTLKLSYNSNLSVGHYSLLVNGRDLLGNESGSYQIDFEIVEGVNFATATVSPNPASDYIRVEVDIFDEDEIESVLCTIYNTSGNIVEKQTLDSYGGNGKRNLYWLTKGNASGLYLYKLEIVKKTKPRVILNGKFIVL